MALNNLASALSHSLKRDFADAFFPRCQDPTGGFHQDYARDWTPTPDETRDVVIQARHVWSLSTLAEAFPDQASRYLDLAEHGFRFLDERMRMGDAYAWDVKTGDGAKGGFRTYGLAFALYALSAYARAGKSEPSLARADALFAWLENAWDPEYGGYFEDLSERGTPIFQHKWAEFKTHNAQMHMLEALIEYATVRPEVARTRLEPLYRIISERFLLPEGCSAAWLHRDLTPATDECSYGHDLEGAHLILSAAQALGEAPNEAPLRLAEYAVAHGWDRERGGFYASGRANGEVKGRSKQWWVAAECLLGLAAVGRLSGDPKFMNLAEDLWTFTEQNHIDPEFPGWFGAIGPDGAILDDRKGHKWKACYHETRALLGTAAILQDR